MKWLHLLLSRLLSLRLPCGRVLADGKTSEQAYSRYSTACLHHLACRAHLRMDVTSRRFIFVGLHEQSLSSCLKQKKQLDLCADCIAAQMFCLWQHVQPWAMGSLVPCTCPLMWQWQNR